MTESNPWLPIATVPKAGRVLLAARRPTSWAYQVCLVHFHQDDPPRARAMSLQWAQAWMPAPPEPPDDING